MNLFKKAIAEILDFTYVGFYGFIGSIPERIIFPVVQLPTSDKHKVVFDALSNVLWESIAVVL